nr:hypothetical protein [uncultured Dongia sp.]
MAKGKISFKQSDLTRAIKAVRAAGIDVSRIEIEPDTGKIIIVPGGAMVVPHAGARNVGAHDQAAGADDGYASQYKAIQDALERSRQGDKPSPIELGQHRPATPTEGEA